MSQATLSRTLDGLEPNDAASFLGVQPEFSTPIWDYISGLVDDERVRDGRQRFAEYRQAALAAQIASASMRRRSWPSGASNPISATVIGGRPVIQSLTTLACTPNRRSDYFHGELIAALKIVDKGDVKPEDFKGSWAGAFGNTQFMPSTFLRLAVDMDGDGRRDVVNSVPDALAPPPISCIAPAGSPAFPGDSRSGCPPIIADPRAGGRNGRWHSGPGMGSTRVNGAPLSGGGGYGLLLAAGPHGPAFLVSRNFDAFYSYNAAESYALAPSASSRTGIKGGQGSSPPGRPTTPASRGSSAAKFRRCWNSVAMTSAASMTA